MWFISVKRNMARLVPATKNACDAAREVMMPAVADAGRPFSDDCCCLTSTALRSAPRCSSCS